jgi:hypothetical protein
VNPPAIKTLPSAKRVAVWFDLGMVMLPALVNASAD